MSQSRALADSAAGSPLAIPVDVHHAGQRTLGRRPDDGYWIESGREMGRVFAALMRHGQFEKEAFTPSAHLPHPLTPAGRAEARAAAGPLVDFLTAERLVLADVIHSSSLLRAWETATLLKDAITERCGQMTTVVEADALAERCLGPMANLTTDAIEAVVARDPRHDPLPAGWKRDSDFKLPYLGAESLVEAGDRVARYIERELSSLAERRAPDCLVLFVGHGGAFRHAASTLDLLSRREVARLSMYYCHPVYIERSTDGTYVQVGGEWKPRPPGVGSVD